MRGKLKSRSPIPPGGEMSGTTRRPQHGALLPALLLLLMPGLCRGQLGVQAPVLVQEPPARLRFSNSTGAQLSCSARGSPPPDVAWLHPNGSPVTAVPGLRQPLGNGTLYFPPFRAEDYREQVHSATYRCRASNLGGAVLSRDVMVRAVVRQDYEVQVYRTHALLGNTAVLRCVIPPFVRDDVSVSSWFRDDTIILPGSHEAGGGRFVVTSTGDLLVRRATAADASSRYSCLTLHALTGERRRSSPAQLLTVTEATGGMPPRLTQRSSTSLTAEQGRDVTLSCTAQGNPPPTFTWWRESGTPVGSSGRVWASQEALHIRGARPEDAGSWECRVNNAFGEQRVHASLQVTAPLQVHVTPHLLVVNSGEPATFNCSVSGSPVAGVEWLHNAEPLAAGRARLLSPLVLHVAAATRAHRGVYQCVARGDGDSAQAGAELRLGDTVPELQWTFVEQALSPGSPVSLRCAAAGSPPPQFTWHLDGRPLTASRLGHRYTIGQYVDQVGDVISHVNVSSVRVQDGGLYTCSAANSMGITSHEARLNIYGPPYVRSSMSPVRVLESADVTLRCPYAGYPISGVSWERRGVPVTADLRHELRDGGAALHIRGVDPAADAGAYVCQIRGAAGDVARGELLLAVDSPPVVEPFNFPVNVREGARAQVTCSVSSGDLPIRFSWLKDNAPIPKDLQVTEKESSEFYSMLVFTKLSSRHSGMYTCVASNNAASGNYSAQLRVKVSPRWLVEPQDVSTLAGNPLLVNCKAEGYPQPVVSWLHGQGGKASDFQSLDTSEVHIMVLSNGTLSIPAANSEDEGFYLCRADNGIGAGLSKVVKITVNEPVSFDVMEKNVTARHGEQVTLKCDIKGDHPIQVDWLFNGQRLNHNYRTSMSEIKTDSGLQSLLVIAQAERHDSGLYTCQAGNIFGHSKLIIHLAIQEPPDPPLDIEVVEINSRSVRLSWHPPFDGHSTLIGYLIQYKKGTSLINDWHHSGTVNLSLPAYGAEFTSKNADSMRTAVITDLHPATTYHIRMLATNAIEASPFTDTLTVKTQEEVPAAPPQDLNAETIGPDELLISWKPPPPDTWNGNILGYIVHWNIHGMAPLDTNSTNTHLVRGLMTTEARLKQLKKFTRYDVYVQAFNSMGPGPKSSAVTATTREGVPDAAPQNVSCFPLSSQSMKVNWTPPPVQHHGGVIQGYKVIYKPVISDSNLWAAGSEVKRTASLDTYLHGLLKFTNYSVRLLAYTSMGDGVLSRAVFCSTEQDVPGSPAAIKAISLTSDSILVSWLPPEHANGIITLYTVYFKGRHHVTKPMSFKVGPTINTHEVRGLKETEQYEFWVTASTIVGEGESGRPVIQTPNSKAPACIASFSQVLKVPLKSSTSLSCLAVGNPTPNIQWLYKKRVLESDSRTRILQDSLHIIKMEKLNEGNYTCIAKNLFGEDHITYKIIVLLTPDPPLLESTGSDHNNIELQWRSIKDGGTPILGYLLNYKRDHGNWIEVQLDAEQNSLMLPNLQCGTTYHAYMIAYNRVGNSHPSATVTIKTKGTEPQVPELKTLLTTNATSVLLHLPYWPDGGCPMLYFVVEYRTLGTRNEWILVDNNVPSMNFLIGDLQPGTWYELRITAHNSAGSTRVHYSMATTTISGATVAPMQESQSLTDTPHFYEDIYVVVSTVCSAVLLLSAGLLIYVAIRRKQCKDSLGGRACQDALESASICKAAAEMDNKRNFQQIYSSSPSKSDEHHTSKQMDTSSDIYEMSPYATFAVSSDCPRSVNPTALDYTIEFKTFGHSENNSSAQHERPHRSNRKHRGDCRQPSVTVSSLHRHNNANEHERKFEVCHNSETDSSGSPSVLSSYRTPIKKTAARSLEMYHADSSPESNEISPLPRRRRTPHQHPLSSVERPTQVHASYESSSPEVDANVLSYHLQPPSGFSNSQELSEAECDRDSNQLAKFLARFHQQKEEERLQYTIHV
ncbi:Down syndrome cell adhesion molecule-like protein Dscam2 [Schistocerca cancellata]|uniref:Down syndrome cell adhesion molecule-like protein Dscam2 n=1 Tax=Schistocerca cancellata TaxID=274614 RepID=UPI00211954A5|nr:Down syndrome cell adhesion molecule-like protein Dscam2 [Schistocerca cancellata]